MNMEELIAELRTRFFGVDEAGMDTGGHTQDGIKVWGIGVFDLTSGVITKKNLTFYTKDNMAYWGNFEPNPDIPVSDPTFTDRTNAFLASKIDDNTIKFGYIMEVSELTQKAKVSAVMPSDNSEKNAIVSEDEAGVFTIDVL